MKFTLYPNGHSHFMSLWLSSLGDYDSYSHEGTLHSEAIGHLESGDDSAYNDLFIVKGAGNDNATYVVAMSEKDPSLNAVYLVNEDDGGVPKCAHELECEEAMCRILDGWKPEDVMLSIRELISFGWSGYGNEHSGVMATLYNKVASRKFVTNYDVDNIVRASLHKISDSWSLVLVSGKYHKHLEIGNSMENTDQAVFWDDLLDFLGRQFGDDKSQAPIDMVRGIFAWVAGVTAAELVKAELSTDLC